MVQQYIQVVESENDEGIEIPSENDGTLLLTSLAAQFPGACGLKYRNPDTGAFRGIRLVEEVLHPPEGVWGRHQYVTVFPKAENKRKGEDGLDNPAAKTKRIEKNCSDLIILGLPWKSTEDDLRKYFGQFGDLVLVQVKRDMKTGQSKGFGFIRFSQIESQSKCCAQRHMIDGRWCDVTIPNSKEGNHQMMNRKVFIGRVTEEISADDLRNHFSKFGEVVDVYTPKPHRAFAFVTFADPEIAQSLCGEDHIIKGISVHVSSATPKSFDKGGDRRGGYGGQGGYNQGGAGGGGGGWNARGSSGQHGNGGSSKANGADAGMGGNQMGMNLLNSAMLAAAQAMLQNPTGWNQNAQGGGSGNMGAGDQQAQTNFPLSTQGEFGRMSATGGSTGGTSGNWWGSENAPSSGTGHYGGWGGSHGGRSGGGGGWN